MCTRPSHTFALVVLSCAITLLGCGDGGSSPVSFAGWSDHEGDAWKEFEEGYSDGWGHGCELTFRLGGVSGTLYANGEEFTSSDCDDGEPSDASDASEVPSDEPEDAYGAGMEVGVDDACEYAFEDVAPIGTLNRGPRAFNSSDCSLIHAPSFTRSTSDNGVTTTKADLYWPLPSDALAERALLEAVERMAKNPQQPSHSPSSSATSTPMASEEPTDVSDCPDFDLNGIDGGSGAGYFDISVRNMTCQEAKSMILENAGGNSFAAARAEGFACTEISRAGETYQYRCADEGEARAYRYWFGA